MKKFTFVTERSDEPEDAIIDITNTAPMDFVGKLRVSKLKIPLNTFPIALIEPSQRGFTAEQKALIDSEKMVPTTLQVCYWSTSSKSVHSMSNEIFVDTFQQTSTLNIMPTLEHISHDSINQIVIDIYWADDIPRWKFDPEVNLWFLTNDDYPIYSWNGENMGLIKKQYTYQNTNSPGPKKSRDQKSTSEQILEASILNQYDKFAVDIKWQVDQNTNFSSVILAISPQLATILGLTTSQYTRYYFEDDIPFSDNDIYRAINEEYWTYSTNIVYNTYQDKVLGENPIPTPTYSLFDFSGVYTIRDTTQSEFLFPVNHIAIQCLDLNIENPEDISINTRDLQGVVVPSHAYYLKTFLISTRNTRSDFLYLSDLTQENYIAVNSPSIYRLIFRILWIDNDNFVHNFKIWRDNVITLQLVLEDYNSEKRPRVA